MAVETKKETILKRLKREAQDRVDDLSERYFIVALTLATFKKFSADDGSQMAAGLAYYGFLSLFPLILGVITLLSFFIESESTQAEVIGFASDYLPGSDELVSQNIASVIRFRGSLGIIAIVGLIWSGSGIFVAMNKSLNRAWKVEHRLPFLKAKAKHLGMAAGVGLLLFISIGLASLAQFIDDIVGANSGLAFMTGPFGKVLIQLLSFAFTFGLFLAVYRLMPDAKTEWRFIWTGALLASVLFELIKSLFVFYIERFTSFGSVYGTIAPIIVLLLWVYFCGLILILGAELSAEYERLKQVRG